MFWEKLFLERGNDLGFLFMALRAVIVFIITLYFIRIAKKRFLGKSTAFDIILSIIMGSLLARTINGSAPLLPSITTALLIIFLHRLLTYMTAKFPTLDALLQGTPEELMKNGVLDRKALIKHHLNEEDIKQSVRIEIHLADLDQVKQCYIENNGKISFIKK